MRYNLFWVNLTDLVFGLINLLFLPEQIVLAKSHVYKCKFNAVYVALYF